MNLISQFKHIDLPITRLIDVVKSTEIQTVITAMAKLSICVVYHKIAINIGLVANHLIRSSIYDLITFLI